MAVADAGPADDAVEWAAAEAAARGAPLVVVHVERTTATSRPVGGEVLAAALQRAAAVAAEAAPTGRLLRGAPVPALLELSRGAGLLVLGGPGGERCRRHPWSLTGRVIARACCPVAVVRSRPRVPAARPGRAGTDSGRDRRRRLPRRAGHPRVRLPGSRPARCPAGGRARLERRRPGRPRGCLRVGRGRRDRGPGGARPGAGALAAALRRRAGEERLPRAEPVAALVEESRGAALLVVGSHGRVLAPPRGPAGHTLLQRAGAPTVVVRAQHAGRTGPGRSAPPGSEAAWSAS